MGVGWGGVGLGGVGVGGMGWGGWCGVRVGRGGVALHARCRDFFMSFLQMLLFFLSPKGEIWAAYALKSNIVGGSGRGNNGFRVRRVILRSSKGH